MSSFVHLHLHSEYSLLDSTLRVRDIPGIARENGHSAVAITDSGALYGAVDFWRCCIDADVKPIIGCELNLTDGSRFDKNARTYKIVLLCESNEGYANLSRIVSKSFTEGFYIQPKADYELLSACSRGLICLSGAGEGMISSAISAGDTELAKSTAQKLIKIFGKENFFIELENHGLRAERQILRDLYDLANELGVGCVATNNVKYPHPSDARAHSILKCIREGRTLGQQDAEEGEYYYKSTEDMERFFDGFDGAIENTVKIADRCDVTFEFGRYHLPKFPLPAGTDAYTELSRQTFDGIDRLCREKLLPAPGYEVSDYISRAEYELSVIHGMGYDDYFLIVADYVNYARKNGIAVGPGRGSGCGSLVGWAMGITGIDPLKYDLYFERFLNPERVSMPDIDIDFDYNRRGEVVEYLTAKYGRERVSQIITFGTLAARAAIRDCGRVLGTELREVEEISSLMPNGGDGGIKAALENKKFRSRYESDPRAKRLVDAAASVEGLPRNLSVHAAGVVITSEPVSEYVPLALSGDTVITQFDMTTIEQLGLLKFDLLSLRNLTVIDDACREIRRSEPDFDIEKIDIDDKAAYAMLSSGFTSGIFQLDKDGMRRVIMRIKPRSIGDIMTAIALYRPGPMDSIPKYLEGRAKPADVKYPHELLKPVLESTYGCLIYQEQVMSVFRIIAGYTLGRADLVRRAMSKKKAEALEAERKGFTEGAAERGLSKEAAEKLFDDMTSFAGYAFNKSHAAAYALITFRTAWLKAHHPDCFFAALLNSVSGAFEKVEEYITEAKKYGVVTEKPDINKSGVYFEARDGKIIYGLSCLKAVGVRSAESCVRERGEGYRSFPDFLERMPQRDLTRRTAEAFIKSGALDCFGINRTSMLVSLETRMGALADRNRSNPEGQMDIFSSGITDGAPEEKYPQVAEFSPVELAAGEREYAGYAFTRVQEKSSGTSKAGDASARRGTYQQTGPGNGAGGQTVSHPEKVPETKYSKIYIKVPSENSAEFRKIDNLCAIFDGAVPVFYYFADKGNYVPRRGGINLTPYLLGELEALAGKESVAARQRTLPGDGTAGSAGSP